MNDPKLAMEVIDIKKAENHPVGFQDVVNTELEDVVNKEEELLQELALNKEQA